METASVQNLTILLKVLFMLSEIFDWYTTYFLFDYLDPSLYGFLN